MRKLTKEEFIEKARSVHDDFYDYSLVEYNGNRIKIKIGCPAHGMFEQIPDGHLRYGCPVCGRILQGNSKRRSTDKFIEMAKFVHGDKYDYSLVVYKIGRKKINILCSSHGVFSQTPDNHLAGQGCPTCSYILRRDNKLLPQVQFIERSKSIHGDKYDYSLVSYNGNKTKVDILCLVHGIFSQIPNSHLLGRGCPTCRASKGENVIAKWLKLNKIQYVREYIFPKLKYKRHLRFDFYLPKFNTLIEYDGRQHFLESYFGDTKIKERDEIKTKFARDNSIQLIRIPYWEFNDVEHILHNHTSDKYRICSEE